MRQSCYLMPMTIAISGLPGSGTSTVACILSKCLGVRLVSAGEIFRNMAKERGLTLEEFGDLATNDSEIDREIDRRQKEIATDARGTGKDIILEGRLSAWMTEPDLAVLITAPIDIRAARVALREGIPTADAAAGIEERAACEAERYMEYYGIDLSDHEIYDLVINSEKWDQEGVSEIINRAIADMRSPKK